MSSNSHRRKRTLGLAFVLLPPLVVVTVPLSAARARAAPTAGGDVLWEARFDGPSHQNDQATAVTTSPDGSTVFVSGNTLSIATGSDWATLAYDSSTGSLIWGCRFAGPGTDYDSVAAATVSLDGSKVFVAGTGGGDFVTIAYEARTGARVWQRRWNSPKGSQEEAQDLALSPDGTKLFVTGSSGGGSSTSHFVTVAYDTTDGTLLWVSRYGRASDSVPSDIAATEAGVFVTGETDDSGNQDYVTVAFEASNGTLMWVRRYNGPGNGDDRASAIAASPDGSRVFITGSSGGAGTNFDYGTLAYDAATGSPLWSQRYAGPGGSDRACCIAVSLDGSTVFVAGTSFAPATAPDDVTLAYDASSGAGRWKRRVSSLGFAEDGPVALELGSGSVFMTGTIGVDAYLTISLDATGGQVNWVRSYDGPGVIDNAAALAVSPDATKVFVTGWSKGTQLDYDFGTVAYAA